MKNEETQYLNKLFAKSIDEQDESAVGFPLIDVPENLTENLYAITAPTASRSQSVKAPTPNLRTKMTWPKLASVAAGLLMAVVLVQVYQQQQTLKQLKQAQTDLATALHYLGEANKITKAHMFNSLNTNMQKAAVAPVVEIGRDAALQTRKSLESATKIPNRRL